MPAWVDRCPQGHTSIKRRHSRGGYRCQSCGVTYAGEPYDARDHDFPVPGDHAHVDDGVAANGEAILATVVDICSRPDRHWAKTREMDASTRRAGAVLAELEAQGLVERRAMSRSTHDCWRPTDAGRARVAEVVSA